MNKKKKKIFGIDRDKNWNLNNELWALILRDFINPIKLKWLI